MKEKQHSNNRPGGWFIYLLFCAVLKLATAQNVIYGEDGNLNIQLTPTTVNAVSRLELTDDFPLFLSDDVTLKAGDCFYISFKEIDSYKGKSDYAPIPTDLDCKSMSLGS